MVPLEGIEPSLMAPEAIALSTELQGQDKFQLKSFYREALTGFL